MQLDGSGSIDAIDYHSEEEYVGQDTLRVIAELENGQTKEGVIGLSVAAGANLTFNVAASELNNLIDVAVSSSGFGHVNEFDLSVSYDPAVVRVVGSEFGRGYPFLQKTESEIGRISLAAFNGFTRGNDLMMIHFERIAEGQAKIEVSAGTFRESGNAQTLTLSAANQEYFYLAQDDTNRDGRLSSSDAVRVINRLSQGSDLTHGEPGYDREVDTNGDQRLSASDALRVINRIATSFNAELEQTRSHPVFSDRALAFLSTAGTIPSFVARPNFPLDDGTPADFVDVTPPSAEAFASAIELTSGFQWDFGPWCACNDGGAGFVCGGGHDRSSCVRADRECGRKQPRSFAHHLGRGW